MWACLCLCGDHANLKHLCRHKCCFPGSGKGVFRAMLKNVIMEGSPYSTSYDSKSSEKFSGKESFTSTAKKSPSTTTSSSSCPSKSPESSSNSASGSSSHQEMADQEPETIQHMIKTSFHLYLQGFEDLASKKVHQLRERLQHMSGTDALDEGVSKHSTWMINAPPFEGAFQQRKSLREVDTMDFVLREKKLMHTHFVKFLLEHKLWQSLLYEKGQQVMRDHGEKLRATMNLRTLLNTYKRTKRVDDAQMKTCKLLLAPVMRDLVAKRRDLPLLSRGLSCADAFFTRASDISALLPALSDSLQGFISRATESSTGFAQQETMRAILVVAHIFGVMFDSVWEYQEEYKRLYVPISLSSVVSPSIGSWALKKANQEALDSFIFKYLKPNVASVTESKNSFGW